MILCRNAQSTALVYVIVAVTNNSNKCIPDFKTYFICVQATIGIYSIHFQWVVYQFQKDPKKSVGQDQQPGITNEPESSIKKRTPDPSAPNVTANNPAVPNKQERGTKTASKVKRESRSSSPARNFSEGSSSANVVPGAPTVSQLDAQSARATRYVTNLKVGTPCHEIYVI